MSNTYSRLAANLPLIRANLCPLAFLGVPEQAYSRAILGVYELTRIELLRDLYLWAYECSTQEYLAIKQELTELDPMRLAWHQRIRETVRQVVLRADSPPGRDQEQPDRSDFRRGEEKSGGPDHRGATPSPRRRSGTIRPAPG